MNTSTIWNMSWPHVALLERMKKYVYVRSFGWQMSEPDAGGAAVDGYGGRDGRHPVAAGSWSSVAGDVGLAQRQDPSN